MITIQIKKILCIEDRIKTIQCVHCSIYNIIHIYYIKIIIFLLIILFNFIAANATIWLYRVCLYGIKNLIQDEIPLTYM